jgi:hypothetical protein
MFLGEPGLMDSCSKACKGEAGFPKSLSNPNSGVSSIANAEIEF